MNRPGHSLAQKFATLIATCLLAACGNQLEPTDLEPVLIRATDISSPVRLRLANGYEQHNLGAGGQCPCTYRTGMSGIVEVDNLGYGKDVSIRLTDNKTRSPVWRDVPARYFGPGSAGKDLFVFEVPRISTDYNPGKFTFAINYTVGGTTYWDNNGGWNYQVDGPSYFGEREAVLGNANVGLGHAYIFLDAFGGAILVKDLAYDKQVKVVYSLDGWRTTVTGLARYSHAGDPGQEWWKFSFPLAAGTSEVEFAIVYEVAGATYWDNNLGANYHYVSGDGAYQFPR